MYGKTYVSLSRYRKMKTCSITGIFALYALLVFPAAQLSANTFEQPETSFQKAPHQSVEKKLDSIIIDKFNYDPPTLLLDLKYLSTKSKELDPEHIGIQFILPHPLLSSVGPNGPVHSESGGLENVPLRVIVEWICAVSHLKYKVTDDMVIFF